MQWGSDALGKNHNNALFISKKGSGFIPVLQPVFEGGWLHSQRGRTAAHVARDRLWSVQACCPTPCAEGQRCRVACMAAWPAVSSAVTGASARVLAVDTPLPTGDQPLLCVDLESMEGVRGTLSSAATAPAAAAAAVSEALADVAALEPEPPVGEEIVDVSMSALQAEVRAWRRECPPSRLGGMHPPHSCTPHHAIVRTQPAARGFPTNSVPAALRRPALALRRSCSALLCSVAGAQLVCPAPNVLDAQVNLPVSADIAGLDAVSGLELLTDNPEGAALAEHATSNDEFLAVRMRGWQSGQGRGCVQIRCSEGGSAHLWFQPEHVSALQDVAEHELAAHAEELSANAELILESDSLEEALQVCSLQICFGGVGGGEGGGRSISWECE